MFGVRVEYDQGDHYPAVLASKGVVPFEVEVVWFNRVQISFGTLCEDPDLLADGHGPFLTDFFVLLECESDEKAEMVAEQIRKGLLGA